MLAPIEWLKQFITLPDDIHDFCKKMTLSGSKVEGVHYFGEGIKNIVTGKIENITKHPDADKLKICQINVGKEPYLQIVTGANNVNVGDIVPVALDGAVVAGDKKITAGKLRGVLSEGMLCSIAELALPKELFPQAETNGIFILPAHLALGEPILSALQVEGGVIEFEITSNRPDCFSIEGLAREAAITYNQQFSLHQPQFEAESPESIKDTLVVEVKNTKLCQRYCARRIDDVKIEESPLWLRRRLELAGIHSINNIVDITNYVMLETGQPMHAFTANLIQGNKIVVRNAETKEKITTLDEEAYELDQDMLVIADAEKPVALAGIMGGKNSQIDADTSTVIFEAACFAADSVRKTATKLGIRTESSARFERIVDGHSTLRALNRACELVTVLKCGKVSSDWLDINNLPISQNSFSINFAKVNAFLGLNLSNEEIKNTLSAVGCAVELIGEDEALITTPTYRPDLEGFADLAEEVARFHDYNNIPATLLPTVETTVGGRSHDLNIKRSVGNVLVAAGFYEAYTYSFMSNKDLDKLNIKADSDLRKPIKIRRAPEDASLLRTTPLPALLNITYNNSSRSEVATRLFEIMRCYHSQGEDVLPLERDVLAAVTYDNIVDKDKGERFYELKNVVEEIAKQHGIGSLQFHKPVETEFYRAPLENECFHPYRSAWISIRNQIVGILGYLHPDIVAAYDLPKYTAVLLLDIKPVVLAFNNKRSQKSLPKYPATTRDLAVVIAKTYMVGEAEKIIKSQGGNLLESVELFDIYEGANIGADKKSIAFRLTFRSGKGTLQDTDVNPLMTAIVNALADKMSAQIRQ